MSARILYGIVGGFLLGVLARSLLPLGPAYAGLFVILAIAALAFSATDRSKKNTLVMFAIACVSLATGIMRMEMAVQWADPALAARIGVPITIVGFVSEDPDEREEHTFLTVDVREIIEGTSTVPVRGRVLALASAHMDIAYGDVVRADGTLALPETFDTQNGRQFNYSMYLAKDGILFQLLFARIEREGEYEGNIVKAAALATKHAFLAGLRRVLPEPEAGLAGGITVGDKRSVGEDLSARFQRVSLVHILVFSGYNITLLLNVLRIPLNSVPRMGRFGAIGAAVVFFVLMAGGTASAVRAGAMALVAVFARATHRVFLAGRILGVVAAAMVFWNPFTLVFDPSFELSALATLGLILYTPLFALWFTRMPEKFGLREILASTCATQLMVLPLLLYQNGNFSLVSLPANLLALIAVPYAMGLSIWSGIIGMIGGPFAALLALPAYALLAYIIGVAKLFAAIPFASIALPAFSAWWLVVLYAALFGALLLLQKRRATVQSATVP